MSNVNDFVFAVIAVEVSQKRLTLAAETIRVADISEYAVVKVQHNELIAEFDRISMPLPVYFDGENEARLHLIDLYLEKWRVDRDVVESVMGKMECRKKIKQARLEMMKIDKEKERLRIERIAAEYAKIIETVVGEKYKDTVARFAASLKSKIEKPVFREAINIIRKRGK